jgi:fido (protein-threonine AMPylation protein)
MSADERLRNELYAWCGESRVCKRAVDYYVAVVKSPCHPPPVGLTRAARRFYEEIVKRHGQPRCDIKTLVHERLRCPALEKYADEIAELAERIKRRLGTRSRTAAAVAAVLVAERHCLWLAPSAAAARFGVSDIVVRVWLQRVRRKLDAVAADKQ